MGWPSRALPFSAYCPAGDGGSDQADASVPEGLTRNAETVAAFVQCLPATAPQAQAVRLPATAPRAHAPRRPPAAGAACGRGRAKPAWGVSVAPPSRNTWSLK